MPFTTEHLAYWFFRLNGCTTLVNFLVHHERRGREGTEVDVIAVRFPHRKEMGITGHHMDDHSVFGVGGKTDVIIAEVKNGLCDLNGPWTNPERKNMHRMLYAIGAFEEDEVDFAAASLYKNAIYENDEYICRLFAIGREKNLNIPITDTLQITYSEILSFIYERFKLYEYHKAQHRQWDSFGKYLYKSAIHTCDTKEDFITTVMTRLYVRKS